MSCLVPFYINLHALERKISKSRNGRLLRILFIILYQDPLFPLALPKNRCPNLPWEKKVIFPRDIVMVAWMEIISCSYLGSKPPAHPRRRRYPYWNCMIISFFDSLPFMIRLRLVRSLFRICPLTNIYIEKKLF